MNEMNNNKLLLLCNNSIALPALRELLFFGHAAAVVVPAKNKDLITDLENLLKDTGVPLLKVDRNNFKKALRQEIEKNKPIAVLIMTFPYLIPKELLNLPAKGFINFHYGRLPEYRGPEPIFTQVMQQEKRPALSVHVVTEGIDNGPIIFTEIIPYDPNDTYGILQRKMANAGAKTVSLLMKILHFGNLLPSVAQDETKAVYHKKPTTATLTINWQTMDGAAIRALANACNPWNKGCGVLLKGQMIGITEVEIIKNDSNGSAQPGTIVNLDADNGLQVSCCNGDLIKINIIYTEEGFMSGKRLLEKMIVKGDRFT